MDLFDVVRSCFRRWYVLLPLLLITGWYTYTVYTAVKPVYYSQAVIGLAPPSYRLDQAVPGQPVPRNGLLDIGGAPFLANMAALSLREPTVVNHVVALGGMPDYIARMFPVPANAQPVPLVMVEQTAPDPASATRTLELVSNEMSSALERIQKQANVPAEMTVNSFVVSPPSEPVAAMPTRTRSTASIAIAGTGLSILVAVLADVLLLRIRRRRGSGTAAPSGDPHPAPPDPAEPVVGDEAEPAVRMPASADSDAGHERTPRTDAADAR